MSQSWCNAAGGGGQVILSFPVSAFPKTQPRRAFVFEQSPCLCFALLESFIDFTTPLYSTLCYRHVKDLKFSIAPSLQRNSWSSECQCWHLQPSLASSVSTASSVREATMVSVEKGVK